MPREPRNVGASVRARLLDRARAERSDFQILLTHYAIERLHYRLSVFGHRDRFILKGAMLFVTWVANSRQRGRPNGVPSWAASVWRPHQTPSLRLLTIFAHS